MQKQGNEQIYVSSLKGKVANYNVEFINCTQRKDLWKICTIATLSRILIFILGKISSILNQPFDKSNLIYEVKSPLGFLLSWDAVHFHAIAKKGYQSEHSVPFFPAISILSRSLHILLNYFDKNQIVAILSYFKFESNNNIFAIISLMYTEDLPLKSILRKNGYLIYFFLVLLSLLVKYIFRIIFNKTYKHSNKALVEYFAISLKNYTIFLIPATIALINFCKDEVLHCAIIVTNTSFVLSALILYKISLYQYSRTISLVSTFLYIFNPATIIFSAFYSESLFTLIFFIGYFYTLQNRNTIASLIFSISCLTRSNGLLFVLFTRSVFAIFPALCILLYQGYSFNLIHYTSFKPKFFVPYTYVQVKYWNQGFLNFLTVNNIPNILVGLPIIIIALWIIYDFLVHQMIHYIAFDATNLDLIVKHTDKINSRNKKQKIRIIDVFIKIKNAISLAIQYIIVLYRNKSFQSFIFDPFCTRKINPVMKLAAILLLQTFVAIFFIHWNMTMRFIAFNPLIYWTCAKWCINHWQTRKFKTLVQFFLNYAILYIIMFSCYYPPA